MYSSVSDAEYQFRRQKAEGEARNAYARVASKPVAEPSRPASSPEKSPLGRLRGLISQLQEDDVLLLGILFLLLNDTKEDDPLVLILLAVLFFC